MSSVYMIVFTVGLAVQILAAGSCEEGAVRFNPDQPLNRGPHAGYVQLCFNNEWIRICTANFHLVHASIVCRQLGYSDQVTAKSVSGSLSSSGGTDMFIHFKTADSCVGTESTLGECTDIEINAMTGCNGVGSALVSCMLPNCIKNDIQLVGGASYREGRVEVCVDGRWGTVCYNEELAGTVCQQLGFGSQGARAIPINIPKLKVTCTTTTDNMHLSCGELIEGGNITAISALTVECQGLIVTTPSIPTSPSPTVTGSASGSGGGTVSAALGAVIGLLIVTQALTIITLVVCVLRAKQQTDKSQQRMLTHSNKSFEDNPPVESAYSVLGPNYETTPTSGGPIPDYDMLDHNRPATVAPAHQQECHQEKEAVKRGHRRGGE